MQGVERLLDLNRRHSEEFMSVSEESARRLYRAIHSTEVSAFKCMDGRIHLPYMTETPLGIISPWRNVGGQFNVGWPLFNSELREWRDYAISRGRHGLCLVTYHFSVGDTHRGCKGFEYDVEESKRFTADLVGQFNRLLGQSTFFTVHVGVETDEDALILHGERGGVVRVADLLDQNEASLAKVLADLFPQMASEIRRDFLPLIMGNIQHIKQVKASHRPVTEIEHKESILAFGRGFDWLHVANKALIVGPFDPNYADVVAKAGGIILDNLKAGQIQADEIVLLISSPFRDAGSERRFMVEKARYLQEAALASLSSRPELQELMPHLQILTGVVNMHDRRLQVLYKGRWQPASDSHKEEVAIEVA